MSSRRARSGRLWAALFLLGSASGLGTSPAAAPPTLNVIAPAPGQTLDSSLVEVSGTSTGASWVGIYVGGILRGAATGAAAANWSLTVELGNGPRTVTLEASGSGGEVSVTRSFTVADSTPPPLPTLSRPVAGATFRSARPVIEGTASGDATRVRLLVDGAWTGQDAHVYRYMGEPPTFSQPLSTLTPGYHSIQVRALDPAGNLGPATAPVQFLVDLALPQVTMLTPLEGQAIASTVTVTGNASDDVGVIGVRVYLRNLLTGDETVEQATCAGCGTTSATWSASLTVADPGVYAVTARAEDLAYTAAWVVPARTVRMGAS